jgi:hypothetical protein
MEYPNIPADAPLENHSYHVYLVTISGNFVDGFAHGAITYTLYQLNGEVFSFNFDVTNGKYTATSYPTDGGFTLTAVYDITFGVAPWSWGWSPW